MATARELHPDEYEQVQALFPTWFGAAVQCSYGQFWPSLGDMDRSDLVVVAEQDQIACGVMLARADGWVSWCLLSPDHVEAAFPAVAEYVFLAVGRCEGVVENDDLRHQYLSSSHGHVVADNEQLTRVRWVA